MQKNNNIIIPSLLVIAFVSPPANCISRNNTTNAVENNKHNGNSFFTVLSLTFTGLIIAAAPNIKSELIMQLPTTFPNTISVLPDDNALIETANSGADVPNAIIVNPINIFETLKFCAVDDAPSTKISAPLISKQKPTINKIIFKNIIHTS